MCGAAQPATTERACEYTTAAHIIENCNLRFFLLVHHNHKFIKWKQLFAIRPPYAVCLAISACLPLHWFAHLLLLHIIFVLHSVGGYRTYSHCAHFAFLVTYNSHIILPPLHQSWNSSWSVRSIDCICVQYSTTHRRRRWMCFFFFFRSSSIVLVFLCDHKQWIQ